MPDPFDLVAQAYKAATDALESLFPFQKRKAPPVEPTAIFPFLEEAMRQRQRPLAVPMGTEEKPPTGIQERYRQFLEQREAGIAPLRERPGVGLGEALGNLGRATPSMIAELLPGETGRQFRELRSQVGPLEAFRRPVEEGGVRFPSVKVPEVIKLAIVSALRQKGVPETKGRQIADAITPEQLGLKGALEAFAQPDILIPAARSAIRGAVKGIEATARLGAEGIQKAAPTLRRLATEQGGFLRAPGGGPIPGESTLPNIFAEQKKVAAELKAARLSRGPNRTARVKAAQDEVDAMRELHLNTLEGELPEAEWQRYQDLQQDLYEASETLKAINETPPVRAPKFGTTERADWEAMRRERGIAPGARARLKAGLHAKMDDLQAQISEIEAGRTLPEAQPTQTGGNVQAGMGIGERPAQGGLFENLRGEADKIPLADTEQMALRQQRQAQIAAGQAEMPITKPVAPGGPGFVAKPVQAAEGVTAPIDYSSALRRLRTGLNRARTPEEKAPFQAAIEDIQRSRMVPKPPVGAEARAAAEQGAPAPVIIVRDLPNGRFSMSDTPGQAYTFNAALGRTKELGETQKVVWDTPTPMTVQQTIAFDNVARSLESRLTSKVPVGAREPVSVRQIAQEAEVAPTGAPEPAAAAPPGRPPGEPPIEPPVGSLEPPPVPPQGAQGRSLLDDLQDVEELVGVMMRPDIKRRIANLPGVRQLQATFNPAAVAQTPVDKGIVARAALREEGKNKAIGAFSTLEALGRRDKVWGALDDQGRLISGRLKGKSLDEVLTYRKKYAASFTPEQRAWTEQFHAIEESKRALLERAGIDIKELSFEEGGEYVGRRVMGRLDRLTGEIVETAYIGAGPGRPGAKASLEKARAFRDINDALSEGFRYLTPDEALFLNLRAAYNRVGDRMATDWILQQVPWRTTEVFSLPKASALVRQAMKKETIPASRLVALRRDMPEIAQRIEAAQAIEDWPTRYSTLQGIKEDLRKIIPETEAKLFWAVERMARDRKNAQAGIAAILRALRGETLPTGTVRVIERVLPDLKGLREQTRVTLNELIRAGEEAATHPSKSPTTILTGQRREALEETLTLLRGEAYETKTATGQAAVKFRGGRVAELRKEELAAIKQRQEVVQRARTARYGEGTVAAPAFQGKILIGPEAKANAEALNRAFAAQYGKLDEILAATNKVNAIGRYFMLAGDASPLMIQLIAFPFRFPHKMPKIILEATKAMFNPEAQAAYLAANNATVQGSRNLILSKGGQTEYTEAFRIVGWVTAKFSPGRLLVPFQRFFEGALDAAGIELRKGFSHLADTPANAADLEQFINEVRGVTSSARLGVSGSIQRGETALFLAPRYNRAFAAWATDVLGGGIRGDQARKSLAALIAGWTAIGVAISLAQGEGWEGAQRHLTPGDLDFMTWTVFGQRVGPGSKIRSALMLLGRITREPERTVDHVNQFVRGNLAPVPGKGLDILLGRNFIGEPTRPGRGVGWGEGMLGLARTLSEGMIPIWSQSVAMEGGDVGGRAVRGGTEFFGGRAYPATPYMEFSGRWRKELKPYFDIPSDDREREAKRDASKTPEERAKYAQSRNVYRKYHPEVEAKLFIIGEVKSLLSDDSRRAYYPGTQWVARLMAENGIRVKDIKSLEPKEYEKPTDDLVKLRGYLERTLGQSIKDTSEALLELSYPLQSFPAGWSATQKWEFVSSYPRMNPIILEGLYGLWFEDKPLTQFQHDHLFGLFTVVPLGQTNFNTWVKQTLRQLHMNAAAEAIRLPQEGLLTTPTPTPNILNRAASGELVGAGR